MHEQRDRRFPSLVGFTHRDGSRTATSAARSSMTRVVVRICKRRGLRRPEKAWIRIRTRRQEVQEVAELNWNNRTLVHGDNVSRLRIVNPGGEPARVAVAGTDDAGVVSVEAAGSRRERRRRTRGPVVRCSCREWGSSSVRPWWRGLRSLGRLLGGVGWFRPKRPCIPRGADAALAVLVALFAFCARGELHVVPLFASASADDRQGFARIVNHSDRPGTVRIVAIDDAGRKSGPVELSIGAGETAHFNSEDLEKGNVQKGLANGVGTGTGDWRLDLESDLDLDVFAYMRTADGFLTSMHDVVARAERGHRVPTFNPGANVNQVSLLRVTNTGDAVAAALSVVGIDDSGRAPGTAVRRVLGPGASGT